MPNQLKKQPYPLVKDFIASGIILVVLGLFLNFWLPTQRFFSEFVCWYGCGYANPSVESYAAYSLILSLLGTILLSLGIFSSLANVKLKVGKNKISPEIIYFTGAVWMLASVFTLANMGVDYTSIVLLVAFLSVGPILLSIGTVMQLPMIRGLQAKVVLGLVIAIILTAMTVYVYWYIYLVVYMINR